MAEGKFAGAYDILFGHYLKPVRKRIVEIATRHKCKKIVDLGCGTGEQCILLQKHGFYVVGIDASHQMLDFARKNSPEGIEYILSDILSLDFNHFDCAILSFVLHGNKPEKQRSIMEKAKNIVGKDGIVIIADYGFPENIKGRAMNILINIIESMAVKEHRNNYRLYVKNGGLDWIMKKYGVIEHYQFYGGAIRIVVLSGF